ncbi:hypothetical protein DAPPUDRAFT_308963 [Daphnia pulex]|uniref:Uncharacterized protein n=1 Tax=Daphnia pulex TaxID=6669 RepID=E9G481_DAPPU|nr:hypothetical protein DAPPUDRAFT_308963 [Daphnia pulex]|eukprot:EFX86058.1 hypothetical protein DAPPUDRAFT_308963 [Daphnia pulex]
MAACQFLVVAVVLFCFVFSFSSAAAASQQEKSSKELRADGRCYWSAMAPICNRFCRPGDQVVGISTTVHGVPCLLGRASYCCPRRSHHQQHFNHL